MGITSVLRDDLAGKWLMTRDGVIAQVEMLTEEQLAWRPGEGARTGLQIARHIAEAGRGLIAYATQGTRPTIGGPEGDPGTREEVLAALREGRSEIQAALESLSEEQLEAPLPGLFGEESPRHGFLAFCYAHEMYHWGQLGLCARAGGTKPALTQMLEARMGAR